MSQLLSTSLGPVRLIGENATPIWGMPNAVTVVGMVHGVLFLLFCVALVNAVLVARWRLKPPLLIFLASLIPFAPLWVEHWLRRQPHHPDRTS